jgi:hypothetical protein
MQQNVSTSGARPKSKDKKQHIFSFLLASVAKLAVK